jgi:hypothetical protein
MDEGANTVPMERRRSARYPCTAAVEILQHGGRWGWGSVNEISHGGCYIEILQLLPIGAEARLKLTMDDLMLEVAARVVSNDMATGMGMEFLAIAAEQERILQAMLKRVGAPGISYSAPSASTAGATPPAAHKAIHITPEATPKILAKVIARINEKGVLTRQELVAIVKECL